MPIRILAAAAILGLGVASAASAQGVREQAELKIREITAQLQAHDKAARVESAEASKSMQANDKAGACTHFKASRAEAQQVLDLLPKQREQIAIATPDTATAVGRMNGVDTMIGQWMTLASQLDERIKAACPAIY